jgi:hypothetical protein
MPQNRSYGLFVLRVGPVRVRGNQPQPIHPPLPHAIRAPTEKQAPTHHTNNGFMPGIYEHPLQIRVTD